MAGQVPLFLLASHASGWSLYAAVLLNDQVSLALHDGCMQGADPRFVRMAGYVVVFLGVYLALFFATRLVYQGIEAASLEPLDRLLGARPAST